MGAKLGEMTEEEKILTNDTLVGPRVVDIIVAGGNGHLDLLGNEHHVILRVIHYPLVDSRSMESCCDVTR